MDGAKASRVFVYRNIRTGLYSIRDCRTGRVVDRRAEVWLADATFRVSQAGRLRVLREGRKNVHAGVRGRLLACNPGGVACDRPVRYNPYRVTTFVDPDGSPVTASPLARLADGRAYIPTPRGDAGGPGCDDAISCRRAPPA
jgi:hypothetical protein